MPASLEFIEELVCDDRFCKYVLNPDSETVDFWNEFRKNNPDKEEEIQEARQLVLLLGNEKDIQDRDTLSKTDEIWQKIQGEIDHKGNRRSRPSSRNELLFFSLKVAAVLLVMFFISFLVMDIQPTSDEGQFSKTENYFQRVTQYGQKASFYLPDGSHVNLNAGSTLYYYVCNECNTRELILEGEAFFDVKRDTERPFIVKTSNLSATVLGTSFNVKAYPEEDKTEVALVTGKVSVAGKKTIPTVLTPHEMATYQHDRQKTTVGGFNLEEITGWKDKILVFEDVSFRELTATLSRWYGVEFIISDSARSVKKFMNRKDYKGKYNNKSLETVLEAISFSYDFDYEIKDKKVWIK
tara:strand:- start:12102 stop:13160 length:1059 start_codon:yes stop_codon:yes gene_type:complete